MILREINRKIIAFVALGFFLLSTSGMVLFYHYCQHAHELVFSMYIDSTEEICQENAELLAHAHHQHQECCHQQTKEKSCCSDHESTYKTVKLKNDYHFSDRQTTPKPSVLSLLLIETSPLQVDILHTSLCENAILRELPPEISLYKPTGKELLTLHHTLKIAC